MPFGTATVVTNKGKGIIAKRLVGGAAPAQVEPKFAAMGTGATAAARTAAAADTALSAEVETRASTNNGSNVTTAQTDDTYQVVQTITATASRAVDEAALFDASAAGNMFTSATFAAINLASGDSIQFTWKVQLT